MRERVTALGGELRRDPGPAAVSGSGPGCPSRPTGTRRMIRVLLADVPDLIAAIEDYLQANNDTPKPFVWTATAESILEKVRRGRVALEQIAS
jgi:hypothetical protein